jgi:hypothetical protein
MPYGIKNENENTIKFMESCVDSVMKTGKNKSSAIAICKVQYEKSKKESSAGVTEFSEESLRETENKIQKALNRLFPDNLDNQPVPTQRVWIMDTFDTYIVAEVYLNNTSFLCKLDYTISDSGEILFSNPVIVERKIEYIPVASLSEAKKDNRQAYGSIIV